MYFPFAFEGPIEFHNIGSDTYAYTVVFVPPEVCEALPLKENPRLRVSGEINDIPIESALMPVRGRWYIMVSKRLQKQIDCSVGDEVSVRFEIADQNAVDIPDALSEALALNAELSALWDQQSAGRKRGFAHRVATAKRPETQRKRIQEIEEIMLGVRDQRGKLIG